MIRLPFLPAFQLARATVRDPKTGVLTVASYRVSKRLAKVMVVAGWLLKPQLLGFPVAIEGRVAWLVLPAGTSPTWSTHPVLPVSAGPDAGERVQNRIETCLPHLPFSPSCFGLAPGWRRRMTQLWLG